MSHLAITINWLLSKITRKVKSETTAFRIPDGISIADFNYDIRYLGRRILLETRGRVNLLSYIDLKNQKIIHLKNEVDISGVTGLLTKALEKLKAEGNRFIYKEQIGGYEDCDDATNRVTFKGKTARATVHELNQRLGEILTSKEIADAILEKTGKSYKPENIKSTVNTVIKRKFEAARAEKGFPYEIRSVKRYQGAGRGGRSVTYGKNSGYGLFKIVK